MFLKAGLILIALFTSPILHANESDQGINKKNYYGFKPFLPQVRNYNLEFGSFWETANLYWLGGQFGFHVNDSCLLSDNCHQYIELTSGLGGRDGQTQGLVLVGLTEEFYFIKQQGLAPSTSVQLGAMTYSDGNRRYTKGTVAITQSLSMAAHENLNIKLSGRVGYADKNVWSQLILSLGLRLDSLVFYIGDKVKSIGQGAINSGKKIINTPSE